MRHKLDKSYGSDNAGSTGASPRVKHAGQAGSKHTTGEILPLQADFHSLKSGE